MEKIARRKDVNPKEGEKKYGDVKYADEKNKKYPISTETEIRAAWSYIGMPKNQAKYSAADVKTIKANIVAAWKEKIDKDGPPSAQNKDGKNTKKTASTSMQKTFNAIVPLSKVIEGENGALFVEGFLARTGVPDHTPGMPEVMDEALSAPHFEDWVKKSQELSNGKSLFNAREMHKAIAAGRGVEFKHIPGQGFWGRSEVVDEATKEKVRKGVITSHSVGGNYGKTWVENNELHYEALPIEVSYVDVGMIPGTQFEYQKADGQIEMRKFATVAEEQPKEPPMANLNKLKEFIGRFAELRKDYGGGNYGYSINPDYARQEAWDIARGTQVLAEAAGLMGSEADEPADAKELAAIYRALLEWLEGEVAEMECAATGEPSMTDETESEAEEEAEEENPDLEASETDEQQEEEEPESGTEAETEAEPEEETQAGGLDEARVEEIVRRVLAEAGEANKTQMTGELQKFQTSLTKFVETATFEKRAKALADAQQQLATDIAKVAVRQKLQDTEYAALQKTVQAYGPVLMMPDVNKNLQQPLANGQAINEEALLKGLIARKDIDAQTRQAYQARLTELQIRNAPALDEPPTFILP